jgi:hypothetical protein
VGGEGDVNMFAFSRNIFIRIVALQKPLASLPPSPPPYPLVVREFDVIFFLGFQLPFS